MSDTPSASPLLFLTHSTTEEEERLPSSTQPSDPLPVPPFARPPTYAASSHGTRAPPRTPLKQPSAIPRLPKHGHGPLHAPRRPLLIPSLQADSLTEEQVSEFKEAFSLFVSAFSLAPLYRRLAA